MRLPPAVLASLVLAVTIATSACSERSTTSSATTTTRATTSTVPALERDGDGWRVPAPLPEGEPGQLLAVGEATPSEVFDGARRRELMYLSQDREGRSVPVTGTLLVPDREAPDGGWPVVSWAHGTTGVADECAPSTTPNLFYNEYAQQARWFLQAGYAVAASDYVGLGTPGLHSYTVGEDLGNAIADIVPAVHQVEDSLADDWFAVGHSEGGQGVLFASRAAQRHPELPLAGTVAIAPSSHLGLALPAIAAGELPADVVYGLYLLVGLSTVDPSIRPEELVGPAGEQVLDRVTEQDCLLDTLSELAGADVSTVFDLSADEMAQLSELLASVGDPDREPTVGPLLVVQGATDRDIPAPITAELVASLRAQGVDVTERVYPGLDHDRVLGPAVCETLAWMADHGGPAPTECVAAPTDMS